MTTATSDLPVAENPLPVHLTDLEIIDKVLMYLCQRGWISRGREDKEGRLSLLGALALVMYGDADYSLVHIKALQLFGPEIRQRGTRSIIEYNQQAKSGADVKQLVCEARSRLLQGNGLWTPKKCSG